MRNFLLVIHILTHTQTPSIIALPSAAHFSEGVRNRHCCKATGANPVNNMVRFEYV